MNDAVNHPSHYTDGGIETIDFIEAKNSLIISAMLLNILAEQEKKTKTKLLKICRKRFGILKDISKC